MTILALRQRSPEWLEARRELITATDIPVLLGLSPYRCEADLADEKQGTGEVEDRLPMRLGAFLEPFLLDEYERATGRRAERIHQMRAHPEIPWAAASPDARVIGERRLVELKYSGGRSRFADGLPQDIEAQVAWQLGVTGYPRADVAALAGGDLQVFEVEADPELFAHLVTVAEDFRRRLAEGGPFARDAARIKRDHPADDGTEIAADAEASDNVALLLALRKNRKEIEEQEARLETLIKARMADAAVMTGPGWRVTWKRTKDREEVDWKNLAQPLLGTLPETEREALVGLNTTVRPGFRPFRVVVDKETE